jgi:hypothetical protein
MVLSPEIQGLDSATKQLEFYSRTTSTYYTGMIIVGVTDAAGSANSLKLIDTVYNTDSYAKQTVYLDSAAGIASGDARVAFVWIRNGVTDYALIDDITISDIPPCPEPIGIGLASATQSAATLTWSSSASAFNIEVGPTGFTQGTGTSYSSTTTSYTATGYSEHVLRRIRNGELYGYW